MNTRERGQFHCEGPSIGSSYKDFNPSFIERKEKLTVPVLQAFSASLHTSSIFYSNKSLYTREGGRTQLVPPNMYHDLLQGISVPLVFCEECQQLLNALLKVKDGEDQAIYAFSALKDALFGFFESHTVLKVCFEFHLNKLELTPSTNA